MANQLLVSPDGILTSIPEEQLKDALDPSKGGFTPIPPPVPNVRYGISPSGALTALPLDQVNDAFDPTKGGFKTLDYYNKVLNEANRQRPIYDSTFGAAGGLNEELSKVVEDVHSEHKNDDIFGPVVDNSKTFKMQLLGQTKDVPLGQVEQYISQGYEFKDQNFQALVDAHIQLQKEHKAGSVGSTLINKAATLFGKGDEGGIEGAIGDRNLLANYVAEHVMYKEHPVAKVVGELAGAATDIGVQSAAGLAGPRGVGREVEQAIVGESKSVPKQVAGFIANEAIENARVMYPQAAVTAVVDKDPKLAAEQLLLGAGIGVGLGGAFKGAGALLGKLEKPAINEIDSAITKEATATAGKEEIENAFRKTLIESGIGEKTTEKEASAVLKRISEGSHLSPTLEKLDAALETKPPVGDLQSRIAQLGDTMKAADPKIGSAVEVLSNNLEKLADKEGNISLQNMQKFADQLGEKIDPAGKSTINALNKEAQQIVMKDIISLGNQAASNADVKTFAAWMNGKASTNIAKSLRAEAFDLGVTNAFSPIFKLIKNFAVHKLAHLAVGAAIGGVAGGHEHGAQGALVGAAAGLGSKQIIHWIEKYASNPENASKLSKWLHGKSASPNAASYLIIDAAHAANQNLQKIAPFMEQIGTKTAASFATRESPIKQILGDSANGLSKDQQFAKLSQHITNLASNPGVKDQHLTSLMAPIADAHPGLAEQMKQDYDNKIQYLHQIMPKNPNPPQPFQKDDKWKPSPADLAEFENHLKIAQNPFVLLDKLKEGKVTAKDVATASMLNPEIMNHMRDELAISAYSGKANLTYQQRLSTSIVMGMAMDASLQKVQQLQSVYAGSPAESQPVPPGASGGKGRKGGASHLSADKASKSAQTMSQRLMSK